MMGWDGGKKTRKKQWRYWKEDMFASPTGREALLQCSDQGQFVLNQTRSSGVVCDVTKTLNRFTFKALSLLPDVTWREKNPKKFS